MTATGLHFTLNPLNGVFLDFDLNFPLLIFHSLFTFRIVRLAASPSFIFGVSILSIFLGLTAKYSTNLLKEITFVSTRYLYDSQTHVSSPIIPKGAS